MFDKFSDAAEKLATNVSRRAFLGRLGQGALVTAGFLSGVFAFAGTAKGRPPFRGAYKCCLYKSLQGACICTACVANTFPCPATPCAVPLGGYYAVSDCGQCTC